MLIIKQFIEKISAQEHKHGNTVVLSIAEARALRDELVKLMADNYTMLNKQQTEGNQIVKVELSGGTW